MKNRKWNEFQKLTGKCYRYLAGAGEGGECWHKAYEVLKEIIADGRSNQPDYAAELYELDEDTGYVYDVEGWLEDYLDEIEMKEEYERILEVCDELLAMFRWEEDNASDIKFMKASALGSMGREADEAEFCRKWLRDEPDNIFAATASIYADIAVQDMEAAGRIISEYIPEGTSCTEENDIIFTAASSYYRKTGNKKEEKRMEKALDEYDKYLREFLTGGGDDEELEFMWDEEDLPFN